MNPSPGSRPVESGITLWEVMMLMVVLGVVAVFLLLPRVTVNRVTSQRIRCICNLKQIGLSTRQWAMDHGDTYPASTEMTRGGTGDHPLFDRPWIHLQVLSNELNTPVVLVCPRDLHRRPAKDFVAAFGSNAVSYFVGMDAAETRPNLFLSGDRNLTTNGVRIPPGLCAVGANHALGWDRTIHKHAGNIGLADGSARQLTSAALRQFAQDHCQTNRLAIP